MTDMRPECAPSVPCSYLSAIYLSLDGMSLRQLERGQAAQLILRMRKMVSGRVKMTGGRMIHEWWRVRQEDEKNGVRGEDSERKTQGGHTD